LLVMYFHNGCSKTLVLVLLFYLTITLAQNTNLQTIFSLDIYSSQKPCARSCFTYGYTDACWGDYVGSAIGCAANGNCIGVSAAASNSCYCRADLQSAAESYLTSCVKTACTVGDSSIDISSAGSIYNYYCSAENAANVPATTTQDGAQTTTTMYVYVTVYRSSGVSAGGLAYSMVGKIWGLFFFLVYISDALTIFLENCTCFAVWWGANSFLL
jgi:hypothetical protein